MSEEKKLQRLLDGRTPVVVLEFDEYHPAAALVSYPGTTRREWVARERLVEYGDPSAAPEWKNNVPTL